MLRKKREIKKLIKVCWPSIIVSELCMKFSKILELSIMCLMNNQNLLIFSENVSGVKIKL